MQSRLEILKHSEQVFYWSQNIASEKQDTVKWAEAATGKWDGKKGFYFLQWK